VVVSGCNTSRTDRVKLVEKLRLAREEIHTAIKILLKFHPSDQALADGEHELVAAIEHVTHVHHKWPGKQP
jgi:hypothetical protein